MFEIKNNRLMIAGIAVGLPNGLYLTTHPVFENENTLIFTDKEQTFYMEVQEAEYIGSLKKALEEEILPNVHVVLLDIQAITQNGLKGYSVMYSDEHREYYEMRLQGKSESLHLVVLITVDKKVGNIQDILKLREFKTFLNGMDTTVV